MSRRFLSPSMRRLLRRGQTGQTIVLLAFGFIALLCFVGIVTDVSLLFVRYSDLRRAVDAAAVAAAGQMRRPEITSADWVKAGSASGVPSTDPVVVGRANGFAYARNVATVNLTARQYIEFYGFTTTNVRVDTCLSIAVPADPNSATDPVARLWRELQCNDTVQSRKLVKVTAQAESRTAFLHLIGWNSVTLEASAVSETAVLDIVMIFDTSESMLNQTSYDDYRAVPCATGTCDYSMRYIPPRVRTAPLNVASTLFPTAGVNSRPTAWGYVLGRTEAQLLADPSGAFLPRPFYVNPDGTINTAVTLSSPQNAPRPECRVRFYPNSGRITNMYQGVTSGKLATQDVWQELSAAALQMGLITSGNYPTQWDGFMPTYDYFGCCNDPNGDGRFTDLVCQPFRQMRQASAEFIQKIDFSRGDRVSFVTFDRDAYIIDPGGVGGLDTNPRPMMTNQDIALDTLNSSVGVRAEPNFYADTNNDGYWDAYVIGGAPYIPGVSGATVPLDYNAPGGFNTRVLGTMNDYPAFGNCFMQNAYLDWPRTFWSSPPQYNPAVPQPGITYDYTTIQSLGFPNWNYIANRFPYWAFNSSNPDLTNAGPWYSSMPSGLQGSPQTRWAYSYELWAGCRDSNVGAALREAQNALVRPETRRVDGSVWVMVMLGDGAAGGTDPVIRNGTVLNAQQMYDSALINNGTVAVTRGPYGAYGLCPYGTPADPGPLTDNNWDIERPFCSDMQPQSRTLCFNDAIQLNGSVRIDIGTSTNCELYYDADDFSRDWADYIGGIENRKVGINRDLAQLRFTQRPTIFTIGFGLDFTLAGADWNAQCTANIDDCLGEELLRYIADVGDNNRVDTDYMQDLMDNGIIDLSLSEAEFGDRDACEGPQPLPRALGSAANPAGNMYQPLPHRESCGNYFNAPDQRKLREVFDIIASRLFTRLTR